MPLKMIKGRFRISGASPDGDSVRFYPDRLDAFQVAGLKVRTNSQGGAQLRLDGIDALETHYRPRVAGAELWRQPAGLADAASAELLRYLGFTKVERDEGGRVTTSTPGETSGHILTRFADKYGRAVAFAFPGQRPGRSTDGGDVHLDVKALTGSANYRLLETGLAYPTFYSLLYPDIRQAMADVSVKARNSGKGVWEHDVTLSGFRLRSRTQLRDDVVILPKLFRRLVDYLSLDETGGVSLAGFAHYIDTRNDRLFTISDGHATELHTLLSVRRQTLKLTTPPENIVFQES
ncbi:thermonuclease family protein [Amycolatopsis jejuensis]|uniref:thermonuclease family protein n=1 Tax=Amycolatopsis jejuensis TaxID=330084 RepID=UPI000527A2A5|nr:nuclease [Amycolatopsis jejuensis]